MKIDVAAPCAASWGDMAGSERVRFCGQCKMNVYNLSGMDEIEVRDLVERVEGRLCVRFYRRIDGTVLTKDCPVGMGQRLFRRVTLAAGALLALASAVLFGAAVERPAPVRTGVTPPKSAAKPPPLEEREHIMGRMVRPPRK